jgi:hypothetical protein
MTSKFVPLLPTAPASAGPGRAVDSAAVSAAFVALASSPAPSSGAQNCAHAPTQSSARPVVTLQRDGDRVTHVRIDCACGQVIELACEY